MHEDPLQHERAAWQLGYRLVAGIDEAGRGPLAGPVVAAAVVLPIPFPVTGIDDSKKLTPRRRADLFEKILAHAVAVGVGRVDPSLIDRINILRASLLAMEKAVADLAVQPDYLLIDGTFPIEMPLPQASLPKGDARSLSIAAASIVAKVTRDRIMDAYHDAYPQYGFSRHKGYPTRAHREAIRAFGCCPIHRRSFRGVKEGG
jgi:ribonuclease HII